MAGNLSVEFNLKGFNRVKNQLRALASFHTKLTDPIIEKHAKSEAKRLRNKPYPSYLPHFTHTRTGKLGGSFRAHHLGPGKWQVRNARSYAAFVIKKGMQINHPSFLRWWTIEDTLQPEVAKLTRTLARELERELDRQPD